MSRHFWLRVVASCVLLGGCGWLHSVTHAADWPQLRFDAAHTAASPQVLSDTLQLQWVREFPPLRSAWPDQVKMPFDAAYDPIVVGQTLLVGSPNQDCLLAYDVGTGKELWRFFTDGPVRLDPAAANGKVYFVSDDGYLYCVDIATGTLRWKFRGGPRDRKILGNERLISTWPARGGPAIADGTVYFAASIWPFMGIFIHALDAETGQVKWTNDGDGSLYMKQPHNTDSFASIAPQGQFAVSGNTLLIPGGRSVPAVYDRLTGKMLRYQLAENGKRGGGSELATIGSLFFNGGAAFELATEKYLGEFGTHLALTPEIVFAGTKDGKCVAYDLKTASVRQVDDVDSKGKPVKVTRWSMTALSAAKVAAPIETLIQAGPRVYTGGEGAISIVDCARPDALRFVRELPVSGRVVRLVAAADRLFAVTQQGRLYCFGPDKPQGVIEHLQKPLPVVVNETWSGKVRQLLQATKAREGYAVVYGIGSGGLVSELVRQSKLHVIVLDPSAEKVTAFRQQWCDRDLYGSRVVCHVGLAGQFDLPPYLASLITTEDAEGLTKAPRSTTRKNEVVSGSPWHGHVLGPVLKTLRPYGGTLALTLTEDEQKLHAGSVKSLMPQGVVRQVDDLTLIVREGALPGSANWTHEHADSSNTRVSKDSIVKAPLGVLWFGGPSNEGILPRHGHGPQPQVIDGRLLIEGVDLLRAIDIYTGRKLWETRLPGVGTFYNNLSHQPGANASGTNFISTSDSIYVVLARKCVRLDPATGEHLGEFVLPLFPGMTEPPRWGYLNVHGEYLIGGADPIYDAKLAKAVEEVGKLSGDDDKKPDGSLSKILSLIKTGNDNMSASKHLVVMHRLTGKVLWTTTASHNFRHNGTCIGGNRLYTIDRLSGAQLARLQKDDPDYEPTYRLLAFELDSGKLEWSTSTNVFGTWLSYSAKHDILMESGRVARDTLSDEPKGMRAYNAKTGSVIWTNMSYTGPAILHGDTILREKNACDILTGKPKMRLDPLTGKETEWAWTRNYGCNTPAASEHLLTFRSGAAGYFDLCNDGGTGNFGGFRSSCTNNLIVAGGVLTVPEFTRTCTCAYQNQTSVGLVHMPDVEMWTSFGTSSVKDPVQRVGINFGAPGDRKSETGTLWLEYPSVGGISPAVPVTITPASVTYFRRNASQITGPLNWVTASGVQGVESVTIHLGSKNLRKFTVKLYFLEPELSSPGQRLLDVSILGRSVLKNFDILKEAGGPNRTIVKEFRSLTVADELTIDFEPSAQSKKKTAIISGIEVIAEGS